MNDDYLWDRTGEPDPQIQQLEEVLGTLRYRPQSLELPAEIRPARRRPFYAPMAIAATIALMILAIGLWLRIHRPQTPEQNQLVRGRQPATEEKNLQPFPTASPALIAGNQPLADFPVKATPREAITPRRRKSVSPGNSLAKSRNKLPGSVMPQDEISIAEPDEVRAAKEQLMLALRVASAKLNFAQRKTQGPPTPGTIRNQHKVG